MDQLVYITDYTYDRNQVIAFESELLEVLGFDCSHVTERNFLRRYLMAAAADVPCEVSLHKAVQLSHYLTERTMQDYQFLKYKPSILACAAICVALHTLGLNAWTTTLEHYTCVNVNNAAFRSCTKDLLTLFRYSRSPAGLSQLQAVNDKYHVFFAQTGIVTPTTPIPFPPL